MRKIGLLVGAGSGILAYFYGVNLGTGVEAKATGVALAIVAAILGYGFSVGIMDSE